MHMDHCQKVFCFFYYLTAMLQHFLAEEIIKKSKSSIINCCGNFSIREVGVLLKKAKMLISIDTSVVHIAYQVKVPIVELMGPQYPENVGAWPLDSKKNKILFDNGPCAYNMRKAECPEDIPCLGGIKTEEVIKAAEELLKRNK